jgi:hypothetical protein
MKKTIESLLGLLLILLLTWALPAIMYGATPPPPGYDPNTPLTKAEAEITGKEAYRIGYRFGEEVIRRLVIAFQSNLPKNRHHVAIQVYSVTQDLFPQFKSTLVLMLEHHVKDEERLRAALDQLNRDWPKHSRDMENNIITEWCRYFKIDPHEVLPQKDRWSRGLLFKGGGKGKEVLPKDLNKDPGAIDSPMMMNGVLPDNAI